MVKEPEIFARVTAGLLDKSLWRSALVRLALIAHTTDQEPAGLLVVVPECGGVIADKVAAVCVAERFLRSTPKVGSASEIGVVAAVIASGKS